MSSYRPKSLDELNSQYDQAMSADEAIKKGVSGIKESENQQKENRAAADMQSFGTESESIVTKVSSPRSVEDISGAVDDFIRHLNQEYAPGASSPRPQKIVPVQPVQPIQKKPAVAEPEPMSDERSELLDNYMKVMTDQYDDDDEFSDASSVGGYLKKKGRKRRKDRVVSDPVPQESVVPEDAEPLPLPEVDYNAADYMGQNAPAAYGQQDESGDADRSYDSLDTAFDQLDEQSERKPEKRKGRIVLRTLFSLLLAGVIVATVAVASLVLVLKVNTGSAVFDQYYFVTTADAFEEANLKAGDLVICKAEERVDDGRFVLCVDRNEGTFFLGKKNGEMVDDAGNKLQLVNGQAIYEDNILGTVKRSFGRVGSIIDLVFRYYIPILSALLICAIGLILIVAVALRNKNKNEKPDAESEAAQEQENFDAFEEDEELPEPEDEQPDDESSDDEEEPEKGKRSKKKKRKKDKKQRREAEPDDAQENEEPEAQESDEYGSDYDSYSDI